MILLWLLYLAVSAVGFVMNVQRQDMQAVGMGVVALILLVGFAILRIRYAVLFAVLLREYGLSYGALGFLVLTNFVTQVGADVAFSKAVDRHGFRPFVLAAGALSLVGLGVFAAAPLLFPAHPLVGFFAGTVIFSGAGGREGAGRDITKYLSSSRAWSSILRGLSPSPHQ